jgi:DNA-binding FrmR family transcriptional regulator|tara:strand:+ start:20467 stop:20820 length:354 start_codon:yes stop_codon:yes gene_type:complete
MWYDDVLEQISILILQPKGGHMAKKKGAPHRSQMHRINRIEGQVRGIKKMVEEERYCLDILTQIKAVKSALNSVEANIVEDHLNHCVSNAVASKSEKETNEMMNEIKSLLKSSAKQY